MRMKVICDVGDPSPVAYEDVYEEGDRWVKIQGCEVCSLANREKCCGNCPMFTELGCRLHLKPRGSEKTASSDKPWNCVVNPYPSSAMSFCALQFKCTKGSKKGIIRRVCDPGQIFIEG